MELKLEDQYLFITESMLLIVPYGIETSGSCKAGTSRSLLIVPYGIETL